VLRPANEFILFRSGIAAMSKLVGQSEQTAVSTVAAALWREHVAEEDDVWRFFKGLARTEREEHARRYPNYRYGSRPRTSVKRPPHAQY
ncbi:hypothetical protein BKA62DRAFT_627466, partial [Auriculariales sp. MPI-PUGE-AT-0066]